MKKAILTLLATFSTFGATSVTAQERIDAPSTPVCDVSCEANVQKTLADLGPAATDLFAGMAGLDPALINGSRVPAWQDFYNLQSLFSSAAALKLSLQSRPSALTDAAPQLNRWLQSKPSVQAILAAAKAEREKSFKPTEYELRLQYFFALKSLNNELPEPLKIPIRRVPFDQRRKSVIEDGRALLKQLEPKFAAEFATTGPGPFAEYEAQLRNSTAPGLVKFFSLLDRNQIRPVIRRPENARFWIPKVGFHNQFVSGSSKGSYAPEWRLKAETALLRLSDEATYSKYDPETMPKYGMLRPSHDSEISQIMEEGEHYGTDIYFLKLDQLADRLSFTPRDSLGLGLKDFGGGDKTWDYMFIPWKYRAVMAPFMSKDLTDGIFDRPRADLSLINTKLTEDADMWRYWEIQIFGSLRLSDVESLEFHGQPPSGAFLAELLKRNIKIFNGTVRPAVEWSPSAESLVSAKKGMGL